MINKYEETEQCEECGAVEGGNIDGCDSCNFTYWFNGKVYHEETDHQKKEEEE